MKFEFSQKIFAAAFAVALPFLFFSCQKPAANTSANSNAANSVAEQVDLNNIQPTHAPSPTEAYRMLYEAVKSKNTAGILSIYSKNSVGMAQMAAGRYNKPVAEVLANGFTSTTFAATLPQVRDERIKDNMGAVEVWNESTKAWEDVPFINEDGGWKLATGDAFNDKWKSPGPGQSRIEQANANAANNVYNVQPSNVDPKVLPRDKNGFIRRDPKDVYRNTVPNLK